MNRVRRGLTRVIVALLKACVIAAGAYGLTVTDVVWIGESLREGGVEKEVDE